jgi:hypothetical protein
MTLPYEYNIEFVIRQVDDSGNTHTTKTRIKSSYDIPQAQNYSMEGHQRVHLKLDAIGKKKGDPLIISMASQIRKFFGWGTRSNYAYASAPDIFKIQIHFENGAMMFIEKKSPYYYLMGNRLTKKNVMMPLARTIFHSCFEKDSLKLTEYMFKMIALPENVQYVLENRTPYWFFDTGEPDEWGQVHRTKIEVRLNTKMIATQKAALEISDGVWCPIDIDDLDKFVNYYYHNHTRGKKWAYKSPNKIWEMLVGTAPTDAQSHLMLEFLRQNRTDKMVEDRAKELMKSLTVKYPDRIKILEVPAKEEGKTAEIMIIKGKLMDWIIVEQPYKTATQKVKTYSFVSKECLSHEISEPDVLEGRCNFKQFGARIGMVKGPICIDNIHTNSSVGDQYAARALALLNDKITVDLVYTIKKYVPVVCYSGEVESRLPDSLEGIDWNGVL